MATRSEALIGNKRAYKGGNTPYKFFMDPYLQKQLTHVRNSVKIDDDWLAIVDGRERCQPSGNKVLMSDGSWKLIEHIKKGDRVISPTVDGKTKVSIVTETHQWFSEKNYDVITLHKNQQKLYSCASNHLIPLNNKVFPRINGQRKGSDSYWIIRNYEADYINERQTRFKKNTTTLTSPLIEQFEGRDNCKIEPYSLGV